MADDSSGGRVIPLRACGIADDVELTSRPPDPDPSVRAVWGVRASGGRPRLFGAGDLGAAPGLHEDEAAPGAIRPFGDSDWMLGLGSDSVADRAEAGAALGRRSRGTSIVVLLTSEWSESAVVAFAEALLLSRYAPRTPGTDPVRARVVIVADGAAAHGLADIVQRCRAVWVARDLANTPPNIKSPTWLAEQATRLAEDAGLTVTAFRDTDLRSMGAGGLLAVGSGSRHSPVMLRIDHRTTLPASEASPERDGGVVALVGKGITFDSGGLSLKPAASMPLMKTDMSGAAAVLATMLGAAWLDIPVPITGVLAIAENMPGGSAMRPGDVVRHPSGRTSEVLNTDAEGRLVLADALEYVAAEVQPQVVVDVATLTGAATLSLSRFVGAVFSNSDALAHSLAAAGNTSGDDLWHMPLVADYRPAISSTLADASNTSTDPANRAGAITAALFLEPFAHELLWAHMDIAGPARAERDRDLVTKGATGYGVRILLQWLADRAAAA